jgi:hypothetical protein
MENYNAIPMIGDMLSRIFYGMANYAMILTSLNSTIFIL